MPVTVMMLAQLVSERELSADYGFAATPGLTEWYSSGDSEELEWAATILAARESLRLLAGDPQLAPRRAVLAIDCDPSATERTSDTDAQRGMVKLLGPIYWRMVGAALVDAPAASADVAAARDSLAAADAGDEDASFIVESAEGHDLLWYATQEIQYLSEDR